MTQKNFYIISAYTPRTQMLNYYRHDMLWKALMKTPGVLSLDLGSGSDGKFTEKVIIVYEEKYNTDNLLLQLLAFARLLGQDYIMQIENGFAYKIDADDYRFYLGYWYSLDDPDCPQAVKEAVTSGVYTVNEETGEAFGIYTDDMMLADTEKPRVPDHFNSKLERDAHLARTYPY